MRQISITSILISDLPMFIKKLITENVNIDSIELVNCSKQLLLNQAFFDLLSERVFGFSLNLSENNA